MATATREEITIGLTTLILDDIELELFHNLLHSGPRLGHGHAYSEAAYELLGELDEIRGEISLEEELFAYPDEDFEGFEWTEAATDIQYE